MSTHKRVLIYLFLVIPFILSGCGLYQASIPAASPIGTALLTPTATSTRVPTSTPQGGGNGQLLISAKRCNSPSPCENFTYLEDLFTKEQTPLFNGFSVFGISPDGSQLLVSREIPESQRHELYITNFDGSGQILLSNNIHPSIPIWSAGTDWITFIGFQDGRSQVFTVHPDGTDLTQVTHSYFGILEIIAVANGGIFWEEGYQQASSIYIEGISWTSLDGTVTNKLTSVRNLAVSMDGNHLVSSNTDGNSITISEINGSEAVTISLDQLGISGYAQGLASIKDVRWVPNNTQFLVMINICSNSGGGNTYWCKDRVFLVSQTGEFLQEYNLEQTFLQFYSGMDGWSWSPDGRMLIYSGFQGRETGTWPMSLVYVPEEDGVIELESNPGEDVQLQSAFWLPFAP